MDKENLVEENIKLKRQYNELYNVLGEEYHKKDMAEDIALKYGMLEGEQHKQWVICQMLKVLLTEEEYCTFIENFNYEYRTKDAWDEGTPP